MRCYSPFVRQETPFAGELDGRALHGDPTNLSITLFPCKVDKLGLLDRNLRSSPFCPSLDSRHLLVLKLPDVRLRTPPGPPAEVVVDIR